jgi:hypothetical protein
MRPHHYHWIVPKLHSNPLLHEIKIKAIARQCRIVWERHGSYYNLKYGLTYGLRFTTEGDIVGKSSGFTCATFVMAIFESCGYKMLDYTLWERTDEDEKWKISIINVLKEFGVSEEEISVIEQERTKSFRYRPEQVGATCFFDQSQWPLPFSQANPKGQELSLAIKKNFDD